MASSPRKIFRRKKLPIFFYWLLFVVYRQYLPLLSDPHFPVSSWVKLCKSSAAPVWLPSQTCSRIFLCCICFCSHHLVISRDGSFHTYNLILLPKNLHFWLDYSHKLWYKYCRVQVTQKAYRMAIHYTWCGRLVTNSIPCRWFSDSFCKHYLL